MIPSLIFTIFSVIFLTLGVPIAVCLGFGASIAIIATGKDFKIPPVMMFDALDSYILIAIPFFILAGNIMARGGMAKRIYDFSNALVGWMRGGLGAVNVVGSMIFGGMSGSATADAAGLGIIEIQEMVRYKYPLKYTAGITLVTSCLSSIIPPSIIMVVYGICAGESVAKMLVAGIFPGILVGISFLVTNYVMAIRYGWGASEPFRVSNVLRHMKDGILALFTPVIIMGGIVLGSVTPTEASCVAVLYAFFVTIFIYKEIKFFDIPRIIKDSAKMTGVIMFIISTASLASQVLTADNVPHQAAEFIIAITKNKYVGLFLIALFLLIVGLVMEGIAALIVLTPILLPIVKTWSIDPIHFGVVMVTLMAIAVMTPPVGVCIYIICNITKLSIEEVSRAILPFSVGLIVSIILIIVVPQISLFLIHLFW
jgi:tripartite ATP-independent transporter DctM subunit